MTKKPKLAYQLLLGLLMLSFTVVACKDKKEAEKTETKTDSTVIKPVDPPVKDSLSDSLKKRPTAPGD